MDRTAHGRPPLTTGIASLLATFVLSPTFAARAAESTAEFPQVLSVTTTFNNQPFDYRIESHTERPAFTIYRLSYPSPVVTPLEQNNTIPAEYYLPKGAGPDGPKRPAVICMHILEGDFTLARMTCSMLASHGIPAIMFKLPYYGERAVPGGRRAVAADPKLFVAAMSQGMEDVRRTMDVLASRAEVDPECIGITGISLGGIVSATAAGIDPRLSRAMPILAGGDLLRIIHHARETSELSASIKRLAPEQRNEVERAIEALDPLRHAARLRDPAQRGRVLMVNAAEDEVIPRPCTEKLAAALGIEDRVIWLDGLGHYTAMAELPSVLKRVVDFFAQDMPPGLEVAPPVSRSRAPTDVVASLVGQLSTALVTEPEEGRCHFIDCSVSVTPAGESTIEGRLRLIRGHRGRFKLECNFPVVGEAALGQGEHPWMVSAGKVLFRGVAGDDGHADPLAFADADNLVRLRSIGGVAAGLAVAPQLLEQWFTITDDAPASGPRTIQIVPNRPFLASLRLTLSDDGKAPHQVAFHRAGTAGTLTFHGWQTNTVAHPSMFEPPSGLTQEDVDPIDLWRTFSAMFDFAMENAL